MDLPKIIDNKLPFDNEFISEVEHCCYAAKILFGDKGLVYSERMAQLLEQFFVDWRKANGYNPVQSNHSEYYF